MKQRGKLRLFGHPVHPMVTHFPMGLLPVSFIGDLLGNWTGASFWWSFAFYTLSIGLIASIPALITGMIDLLAIPQQSNAERTAMRHMSIMITAIVLFTGSLFVRYGIEILTGWRLYGAISLSLLGLILLLAGGWHGGQLVYRYAVGSEPISDDKLKSESVKK